MMPVLEQQRRKDEREHRESIRVLAQEFGRQRGWIRSSTRFSLEQLQRRSSKILAGKDTIFPAAEMIFYREPLRPYRPAAIAAHFHDWPEIGPEIEQICEQFGLRYEAVAASEFPCWMDDAQLIVFTPTQAQAAPRKQQSKSSRPGETQFHLPFVLICPRCNARHRTRRIVRKRSFDARSG